MPLSKNSCGVSRRLEGLGQGECAEGHAFTFEDRMSDTVFEFMPPSQKGTPCGGTGRAHMEIGEPQRFASEFVEIGRFKDGVPLGRDVSIPLVVGEEEKNVGSFSGEPSRVNGYGGEQGEEENTNEILH